MSPFMVPMMAHQDVHCLEFLLRESLLDASDVSLDSFNDGPPGGALLGASLEESGYGAESWSLFDS